VTALIEAVNISKTYRIKTEFSGTKTVHAADDVSLTVNRGEAHGLAGESGCGKTTLAKLLLRLENPDSGSIRFEGRDFTRLSGGELKQFRRQAQIIFQDPHSSLDPRMTVREIIEEPLIIHSMGNSSDRLKTVAGLMDTTGLSRAFLDRYPHEFSGGQRQRIGIARALALNPKLIVADECVSALDVSIQAQILNLLKDLREELGLSYLFVSHDLSVMRFLCDRVTVMYAGKVVETNTAEKLLTEPQHPYTKTLLAAVPDISRAGQTGWRDKAE